MQKSAQLAVVYRPAETLTPYAKNARTHSEAQVAQIAASIKEFGFTNPILVDGKNGVIAGHGRLLAAKALGMEKVPTIELAGLTASQKRAYVLADNRLAMNAGWDDEMLAAELAALNTAGVDLSLLGFTEAELATLMAEPSVGDPEETPDPAANPVVQAGQYWHLGKHRLLIGDSTDAKSVARLMAGRQMDLVVTSPPYNQKIDGFRPSGMHKEGNWVAKVGRLAYSDNMNEVDYQAIQSSLLNQWYGVVRDGGAVFYNHKNRYREKKVVSPMSWLPGKFTLRQEIIWRRPGSVTQNARMFLPCDERIFWLYKGADFTFNATTAIKTWSSVWDIPPKANLDHAVAFPVELPRRCIAAASRPDDAVYDPFCGSGTTLIAAEMEHRVCYAMELDPVYGQVIIERWQQFTGKVALLDGKTPFSAIKAPAKRKGK